jgi:HWE histidine kinase
MTGLLNGVGETRSCPGCKVAMRLVGIEPHHLPTSNDNIYTFECVVCGMTTAEAVSASTLTELMGDISLTVSPIKDARGKIASKIARDITERRKRADAQIVILAREAEHRAKNILANVQAAVRLSRSDTPDGLKQSIEGRIQALARITPCDSTESSKSNLQGSCPPKAKNRLDYLSAPNMLGLD